jgi:hypothetical protein
MGNYAKLAAQNNAHSAPKKKVVGRPFPKGVSGNPGGRPKTKPISDMFRVIFDDPATVKLIQANVKKTLTAKGMAGVLLLNHITDRLEGKMPDELNVRDLRDLSDEELEERAKKLDAAE